MFATRAVASSLLLLLTLLLMLTTLLLRITSPLTPTRRSPLESAVPSVHVNAGVLSSSSSQPPTSAPAGSCSLRPDYATMCLGLRAPWSGTVSLAPLAPRRLFRPGVVHFDFGLDLRLASWPRPDHRLRLCLDLSTCSTASCVLDYSNVSLVSLPHSAVGGCVFLHVAPLYGPRRTEYSRGGLPVT